MTQLFCEQLALGYSTTPIVENINLRIERGDYLCIVGENGVGKSTLVKTLLGLIPPLSGSIRFGEGLRQCEVGYLPQQNAFQRDFPASVEEVVQSGCLNRCGLRPFYNRSEKALAQQSMKELDILPLRKRCYRELSGGQQQRVLLARALCATRKLLLLDEPVAGLDPKATEEMYAVIRRLNQEGVTILMISHDVHAAVHEAKSILHLSHKPLFYGACEEYRCSDVGRSFLHLEGGAAE